jgi:hypothetical protein
MTHPFGHPGALPSSEAFFQVLKTLDVRQVRQALTQQPALAQQRWEQESPLVVLRATVDARGTTPSALRKWAKHEVDLEQLLLAHGSPFRGELTQAQQRAARLTVNPEDEWRLFRQTLVDCFHRVDESGVLPSLQTQRFRLWLRAVPEPARQESLTEAAQAWIDTIDNLSPMAHDLDQLSLQMLDLLFEFQPEPAVFKDVPQGCAARRWVDSRMQAQERARQAGAHRPLRLRRRGRT